jgi:acetyl esterase/lipase
MSSVSMSPARKGAVWLIAALMLAAPSGPVAAQGAGGIVVEEGVVYGVDQGSALLADLAYPAGAGLKPAIIYVHGGSWRAGSRTGNGALDTEQWARFGFLAMTIDYRLVLATPAPAPYQDVQTAIRWVHAHADEYGIDPDRVYLIGNSAGGHLVSLAATLGEGPYPKTGGWESSSNDVRAVISVSGAYDVNALSWGNLWSPIGEDEREARRLASPVRHVGAGTKPMLVLHSDDDQAVPVEQASSMVRALESHGVTHRFVRYQDTGHMGIIPQVVEEARAFIAEVEAPRR